MICNSYNFDSLLPTVLYLPSQTAEEHAFMKSAPTFQSGPRHVVVGVEFQKSMLRSHAWRLCQLFR